MPIRVGIIGLSAQQGACTSSAHIGPLRANLSAECTVTALATSSPASAAAAAKQWGLPANKAYSSAEAIANDPDVDLVVVGVKLPVHKELALPALKAGKDVFVEWPLAIGQEDIEELVQAAKEGGGRTVMGLQARCSPVIQKVYYIGADPFVRHSQVTYFPG
jgi:predicted dehydrogenase